MEESFGDYIIKFIREFSENGGDQEDWNNLYEEAIKWAHQQIENLPHVERVTLGDHPFLISEENEMAVFLSTVRWEGENNFYKVNKLFV